MGTKQISMNEGWEISHHGNHLLYPETDDVYFISFQPNRILAGNKLFAADTNKGETAIVIKNDSLKKGKNRYLILNGDFRKEMEVELKSGGLEACKKI